MTLVVALRLGRVSNLPTVWTNALAACALTGADLQPSLVVALALSMSLFYEAGMFLNDAFDREVDARERPERPIPSGAATAQSVFAAGFALLAAGLGLLFWTATALGSGARAGSAGALLALAIVGYDLHHKQVPWAPVVMGACRALVYATCALAWVSAPPPLLWAGATLLLGYVVGLSYAARQENLGRLRNAWPLLLLGAPAIFAIPALANAGPMARACFAGYVAWLGWALWRLMRPAPDIRGGVSLLIAGISFLDALLAALAGAPLLALTCATGAPLTVLFQRRIAGT
jgi:4-hydroxybenzoate polyprenyltransferase